MIAEIKNGPHAIALVLLLSGCSLKPGMTEAERREFDAFQQSVVEVLGTHTNLLMTLSQKAVSGELRDDSFDLRLSLIEDGRPLPAKPGKQK